MKRFLFTLVLMLAGAPLWAAEPTPAPAKIDVKPTYAVHEPIVATLTGGTGICLWNDPEGFDVIEERNGTILYIWAPPGTHKLKCVLLDITSLAPLVYTKTTVRAEFTVGTVDPPKPPLNQKWQIAFFYERTLLDDFPAAQREILAGLDFRKELLAKGHKIVCFYDKDIRGPNATIPANLKPWFDAIENDPLPRVAFAPIEGGPIKDFALPADKASLGKLLEKGGE
jgi:hypothetical protein